MYLTNVTLTGA